MNFPVGSKVVTTKTNRSYEKGWEGKVVQVDTEEPTHLVSFEQAVGGLWTHSYDLKLVGRTFKEGDRVQVKTVEGDQDGVGWGYVRESAATVVHLSANTGSTGNIKVLADNEHADSYGDGWWIAKKFVTPLVEEPVIKVGDTVEALRDVWSRVPKGTRLIVTTTHPHGAVSARVEDSSDPYPWFLNKSQFKRVPATPAPKTEKKKKATLVDDKNKPQIGDTIVAFWEINGVEYRQKGVVARIDSDGTLATSDGNHINVASSAHSYSYSEFAPHVYIVERAPRPEPVKVDLDEEARVPYFAAAVGSKITHNSMDLQYIKTGKDEWSLVFGDRLGARRDTKTLIVDAAQATRLTLHAL